MDFLLLFGVLLAAAIMRLFVLYIYKDVVTKGIFGDASIHYILIRHLKYSRKKIIDQFLIGSEPISYPLLFHRVTKSLFPLRLIKAKPYLPNYIYFILYSLIFIACVWVLFPDTYAVLCIAFFAVSMPNLFYVRDSENYLGLSERYFARINCGLSYFSLVMYIWTDEYVLLGVSLISGTIAILSSKFARQVILFVYPIYALTCLRYEPLVMTILIYGLGFLVKGASLKHSLMFMFVHLKNYSKTNNSKRKETLSSFLNISVFFKTKGVLAKLKMLLFKEPTNVLIRNPELIFLAFLSLLGWISLSYSQWNFIVPVLIVFVLTSTRLFSFLGEAHRYIDYSLYYLVPVLLGLQLQEDFIIPTFIAVLIVNFALILLAKILTRKAKRMKEASTLDSFVEGLSISGDQVVYPIPLRLGPDLLVRKECKTFWWQPGNVKKEYFDEYIEVYPFPKCDYSGIFTKHNVDYIICDKIQFNKADDLDYNLKKHLLLKEDEHFAFYKVQNGMELDH